MEGGRGEKKGRRNHKKRSIHKYDGENFKKLIKQLRVPKKVYIEKFMIFVCD